MKRSSSAKLFAFLTAASIMLTGCTIYSIFNNDASLQDDDAEVIVDPAMLDNDHDGVYTPTSWSFLPYTYKDLNNSRGADSVKPIGNEKILVLPIEFMDYPFSDSFRNDLDTCLSASGSDETGYWESLASFYKKSSFGKYDISFEVAPAYRCGLSAKKAYTLSLQEGKNKDMPGTDNANWIVQSAFSAYRDDKKDMTSFDGNGDGYVDGVIAIYSCPDFTREASIAEYDKDTMFYWAYTFWTGNEPKVSDPVLNTYFWASYDFLYASNDDGSTKVDSHTLVHEYGHMLGLDDYYPDPTSPYGALRDFEPVGELDMMDGNILDHDIFSKISLGWSVPKIVYDNATVTLKPSNIAGDSILIPTSKWNGTAWDEYMLLEFYTPTGLNALDSQTAYPNRHQGYTIPGIKLYHVDNRVQKVNVHIGNAEDTYQYEYLKGVKLSPDYSGRDVRYYQVAASNNYKEADRCNVNYSLIHLIESNGVNTFKSGAAGSDATLFQEGDSFSLSSKGKEAELTYGEAFFPKFDKMNNDASFPYEIVVESLNSESATIRINKR